MSSRPRRIISGGQTGVDRAALDAALAAGLECGGWVPRDRWAEDGPIPRSYPNLRETREEEPDVRTRLNVRDSDATLVLSRGAPSGGTALTITMAQRFGKPFLQVDLAATSESTVVSGIRSWLEEIQPETLNVAGPRSSEDEGIYETTRALLSRILS